MLHAISHDNINILPNSSLNMSSQFAQAAKSLQMATVLFSSVFLSKKYIKPRFLLIYPAFLAVFILSIVSIIYWGSFPACWIDGIGFTPFKTASEVFIASGSLVSALIFYKFRKSMDNHLFLCMEAFLISQIIYSILFSSPTSPLDMIKITGHIFKVASAYFLYYGIIINGLQRPLETLVFNLGAADIRLKTQAEQRAFMEEDIMKNEKCYEMMINNSSDGILICSEGKFIYANLTATKMWGAEDISDLLNVNLFSYVHPDYIPKHISRIKEFMETKSFLPPAEIKIIRKDHKCIDVEVSSSYIIFKGKPCILIMFKDIAYRKKI